MGPLLMGPLLMGPVRGLASIRTATANAWSFPQ
jgi:hypothetical protein